MSISSCSALKHFLLVNFTSSHRRGKQM
uniref:Uncharacterized protein n=1 Tax=Anopheles quadriannulatus TaxID=34691 RepID=A0A182XTP3_ANOQN